MAFAQTASVIRGCLCNRLTLTLSTSLRGLLDAIKFNLISKYVLRMLAQGLSVGWFYARVLLSLAKIPTFRQCASPHHEFIFVKSRKFQHQAGESI